MCSPTRRAGEGQGPPRGIALSHLIHDVEQLARSSGPYLNSNPALGALIRAWLTRAHLTLSTGEPMSELVFTFNGELLTTSHAIALGIGSDHASVMALVRQHRHDLILAGSLRIEVQPFGCTLGGLEIAYLNARQASMLLTLMRATATIRAFRRVLLQAFDDAAGAGVALHVSTPQAAPVVLGPEASRPASGQLNTFTFDSLPVRVYVREDGSPWWVASDACTMLDLENVGQAIASLDADEKLVMNHGELVRMGVFNRDDLAITRLAFVSESGLYALIFKSRKPQAKAFKKWITSEVLPSIRKTGAYGTPKTPMEALNDPAAMRGLLLNYTDKVLDLQAQVEDLAPKAQALDRIATATDGAQCITSAAKTVGMAPMKFFAWLQEHTWIYRRPGGHWMAYQNRIHAGLLEHKVTTIRREDGSEKLVEQVLVTPKGLAKLSALMA